MTTDHQSPADPVRPTGAHTTDGTLLAELRIHLAEHTPGCNAYVDGLLARAADTIARLIPETARTPADDERRQRVRTALNEADCHSCGYSEDADYDELTVAALAALRPELDLLAELAEARQHGAYTYCPQLVGHVTTTAFARKISEKRNAIGQREEAVRYANEQQHRAEEAEAQLSLIDAMRQNNLDAAGAGIKRAEQAEAEVRRLGLMVDEYGAGARRPSHKLRHANATLARIRELADAATKYDDVPQDRLARNILHALDTPAPADGTEA